MNYTEALNFTHEVVQWLMWWDVAYTARPSQGGWVILAGQDASLFVEHYDEWELIVEGPSCRYIYPHKFHDPAYVAAAAVSSDRVFEVLLGGTDDEIANTWENWPPVFPPSAPVNSNEYYINETGTQLARRINGTLHLITLSTPWDLSTASFDNPPPAHTP